MSERILFVDDEPAILSAYTRRLRKRYDVTTADSGAAGLEQIERQGPFAVVVSDFNMPNMDGVAFLRAVRRVSPDTVRLMLTGNAALQTAIDAVNEGAIFRFLTKPCGEEVLSATLDAGIGQHRLITAERRLLEDTLKGSVQVLTEILSMVDPAMFGRAEGYRAAMQTIARALGIADTWELEVAAMLSGIGYVMIPPVVMVRHRHGKTPTPMEREMLSKVAETGYRVLRNIPHLESVADVVLHQSRSFNADGEPTGKDIPLGARILRILSDLRDAESDSPSRRSAFESLNQNSGSYDPELLGLIGEHLIGRSSTASSGKESRETIPLSQLRSGHVLADDIESNDGTLLLQTGQTLTESLLERIVNFSKTSGIKEPVVIRCMKGTKEPI